MDATMNEPGHLRGPRWVVVVLLAATWAPLSYAAPIDPANREEAQARFDRGREFFEEGDFAAALVEFRRANELSPNYRLLYNIAQVCYQLQDYPCALQSFNKYLGDGGSDVPPARVADVQRELEKLRARVARVVVSTNVSGAEISVDDVPAGKTPLGAAVVVSAGRRRISASLKGYLPVTKTVEVAGQELLRLALDLTPMEGAGATEPQARTAEKMTRPVQIEKEGVKRKLPSPWLWAIPGALLATGVPMGIWALRESQAMIARQGDVSTPQTKLSTMNQNTKTYALVSDILDGAAIVSAVVLGLLTLFAPAEPPSTAQQAPLSFGLAPNGFALTGHF